MTRLSGRSRARVSFTSNASHDSKILNRPNCFLVLHKEPVSSLRLQKKKKTQRKKNLLAALIHVDMMRNRCARPCTCGRSAEIEMWPMGRDGLTHAHARTHSELHSYDCGRLVQCEDVRRRK